VCRGWEIHLIEVFGKPPPPQKNNGFPIAAGHKCRVLAVDPRPGGTVARSLGDKTRMEKLSRAPEAFNSDVP